MAPRSRLGLLIQPYEPSSGAPPIPLRQESLLLRIGLQQHRGLKLALGCGMVAPVLQTNGEIQMGLRVKRLDAENRSTVRLRLLPISTRQINHYPAEERIGRIRIELDPFPCGLLGEIILPRGGGSFNQRSQGGL